MQCRIACYILQWFQLHSARIVAQKIIHFESTLNTFTCFIHTEFCNGGTDSYLLAVKVKLMAIPFDSDHTTKTITITDGLAWIFTLDSFTF